jgi:glyoxylase-like metal-dependent hydrolase (beta-lactamase superfamily II)
VTEGANVDIRRLLSDLGLTVLERGWLSSNNIVCHGSARRGHVVVDTGYDTHSAQTVALVDRALEGEPVSRVVNTHLHSDHCGGNAALAARWGCEAWVPSACADAARSWDQDRLSFQAIDQRCARFPVAGELAANAQLLLGDERWLCVPAPGHDPTALMFFQPEARVLISGDALWQDRLAIIFPELVGDQAFCAAHQALDAIAKLDPILVIPGHGTPFTGVRAALEASRSRLRGFESQPQRHFQYAARALLMFRLMEVREIARVELLAWAVRTPMFAQIWARLPDRGGGPNEVAAAVINRLLADGLIDDEADGLLRIRSR